MNLQLENSLFIIGGATSGLGLAIANSLIQEGASIIAIARNAENLAILKKSAPSQIATISGDLCTDTASIIATCDNLIGNRKLSGILINAGGPPAKTVLETTLNDWDDAYKNILRWKIAVIQHYTPKFITQGYGRILCIESSSVKQPIENLVLSNSIRLAVVGLIKTLSQEIAATGVTANIIAPGSHNTPAINRLYIKKSEQTGLSVETTKSNAIKQIPVQALGAAEDFASLATWLLSPISSYITGQTFSVDGGAVKGTF